MKSSKKNLTVWSVVLVLVLLIGGLYLSSYLKAKKFSVLYLTSGEIYVGHIHTFPKLVLKGGYILQNVESPKDATKKDLQLFPLAEALWAPTHLYINREQVLFYGPLNENSIAAIAIKKKIK